MSAIREVSISKDAGPLKSSLFANGQKHIIIANCKLPMGHRFSTNKANI
jgi:hypothetical protein